MADWVHELCDGWAEDAPAVWDHDDARYSYGDLRGMIDAVAEGLIRHGVRPGDRVMLVSENCAVFAAAVLAISKVGAWIMPVNARHTVGELRSLLAHAEPSAMLFPVGITAEADAHAKTFDANAIIDTMAGGLAIARLRSKPELVQNDPTEQVGALLYTTGTTSAPKGVMLTHKNLTWNADLSAKLRGVTAGDLVLGVLPGSHIFGFASTMMATFHIGACIRFLKRFDPQSVLDALRDGASVMPAVPAMYARIIAHLDKTGATLNAPHLHYISAGGAPLDPDLKRRVQDEFGLTLNNGYGITEAAPSVAATRPSDPRDDVSCGPPLWGVTLTIDAPNDDGVGEIIIDSPGVMKGYYRNPEATDEALPSPGVFRSGDLGRIDEHGMLYVEGRKKELIIRSGFNVYPPEVEGILTKHDLVTQAAVVPRRRAGDEDILAFVMVTGAVDPASLAHWLRQHLVAYKLPNAIFVVDAFPVAPTGKILKHKLIDHFADQVAAWDKEHLE